MNDPAYRITRLCAVDGGDGVRLTLASLAGGEGDSLTISADDLLALGVERGEIDAVRLAELTAAAGRYDALRAAYRMLAAGQCSRRRLYEKLRARRISDADARFAIEQADEKGYIDEAWQLKSYVRTLTAQRLLGPRKLYAALLAKGYRAAEIRRAIEENYGEDAVRAAKRAFLEKKFGKTEPQTREEAQAMRAALYKQGF